MDDIVMVGVSHGTVPLRVLERLAVRAERLPVVLGALVAAGCEEAVVLSTCSRTEVYAVVGPGGSIAAVRGALLAPVAGEPVAGTVERVGRAAEAHLFAVAAGLTSNVVGEVEVQGQVRAAARSAEQHGSSGPRLRPLFAAAVATARRAHRATGLAALGRSVGRSGVDVALLGLDPAASQVAVVGTGRMAAVATRRLAERGVTAAVHGRCVERAGRLTGGAGPARTIDDLPSALAEADVVVCATSASAHLVTAGAVRRAMSRRGGRPLTLLDLAVPRNVESAAATVPGVRLVDLEGLHDAPAAAERAELAAALAAATAIVDEGLARHEARRDERAAGPFIAQLHRDAEAACRAALRRLRPELDAGGGLERAARTVSRRLVHRSILEVRAAARRADHDGMARIAGSLSIPESAIARALDLHHRSPATPIAAPTARRTTS
jgi:glutamyl-tRNA reductase